jgi:hypothetical protein
MTLELTVPPVLARRIRDVPIRRKLMVIAMVTTASALLLTGAGIVLCDSILFRGYLQRDLSALARITADNTTGALAFDDPAAASDILFALRARPHLVAACIYRANGTVLATYVRPDTNRRCPAVNSRDSSRFVAGELIFSRQVLLKGRVIGSLTFLYDLRELTERMRLYSATVGSRICFPRACARSLPRRLRSWCRPPRRYRQRGITGSARPNSQAMSWAYWWTLSTRCCRGFRPAISI